MNHNSPITDHQLVSKLLKHVDKKPRSPKQAGSLDVAQNLRSGTSIDSSNLVSGHDRVTPKKNATENPAREWPESGEERGQRYRDESN